MSTGDGEMPGRPERDALEDELGAYLLGSLSPEEEERVEELLQASESARERLRWMQPAVGLLGETVERREPPAALRARILDDIGADVPAPAAREAAGSRPERRGWFRLGGLTLRPAAGFAVILAALLVAGIGFAGYEIGTGGSDGGSRTYASGNAQLSVDGDHGNLELTHVAGVPSDRSYQAWVQQGDEMIPSSLFGPFKNGTATAAIPHHLDGAEAVVVTVEPKGGSRAPTGPVVASVKLQS